MDTTNTSDTEAGCYKADGVVNTIKDGFELLILETSGCYGNADKPRQGFDHVKGVFGARMMLRSMIITVKLHMTSVYILPVQEVSTY